MNKALAFIASLMIFLAMPMAAMAENNAAGIQNSRPNVDFSLNWWNQWNVWSAMGMITSQLSDLSNRVRGLENSVDELQDSSGLNCWDSNKNGKCNKATEDINNDGKCNALDCVGPAGLQGEVGPMGPPGKDGINGRDGLNGTPGADGRDGLNGKDGIDGMNGTDGVNGLDGKDGADGEDGKGVVTNILYEPQGSNCANGGYKIEFYRDMDNDGVYQAGTDVPLLGASFSCNGADGQDGGFSGEGSIGQDGKDGISCWDLNGNGACDNGEDKNGDGCDALDCQGPKGEDGSDGLPGASGANGVGGYERIWGDPSEDMAALRTVTAQCPSDKKVIGGGFTTLNASDSSKVVITKNYPSDDQTWTVIGTTYGSSADRNYSLQAYAICAIIN